MVLSYESLNMMQYYIFRTTSWIQMTQLFYSVSTCQCKLNSLIVSKNLIHQRTIWIIVVFKRIEIFIEKRYVIIIWNMKWHLLRVYQIISYFLGYLCNLTNANLRKHVKQGVAMQYLPSLYIIFYWCESC